MNEPDATPRGFLPSFMSPVGFPSVCGGEPVLKLSNLCTVPGPATITRRRKPLIHLSAQATSDGSLESTFPVPSSSAASMTPIAS